MSSAVKPQPGSADKATRWATSTDWARTAAKVIMTQQLKPEVRIARYRENHRIAGVELTGNLGSRHYCAHDGIRINPVRNGWRHDVTEVRDLSTRALTR